jgi:hypothetical protein
MPEASRFSGEPDVGKSACPVRRGESGSHRKVSLSLLLYLRAFGLANSALAMIITVWIAEGHPILAALIALVGIVIGVKALTVKPAMDRVAIYDSNR